MRVLRLFLAGFFLVCFCRQALALNDVYVIHFVLDGLRADVLNAKMREGQIPFLKKFFYEEGATFEKALTTFPTVSSPGYISFVTGLGAGNSGIFFLEWFDRVKKKPLGYLTPSGYDRVGEDLLNRLALRDVKEKEFNPPTTLFEKLSPLPTASVYSPIRRGATIAVPRKIPWAGLFNGLVSKNGLALDRLAMKELTKIFSKPDKKLPRYTLAALYGTDFLGHKEGPASEEIEWDLRQFDLLFEKFAHLLQNRGLLEKTYFVLSSDHGMHRTGKHLDLRGALKKGGVGKRDNIYVSNRGVSSTFIYVAGEKGWKSYPSLHRLRHFKTRGKKTLDLIQTVLETEGVAWIAVREKPDRVRVYHPKGEGAITRLTIGSQNYYSYITRGKDPLGYDTDPKLAPWLKGPPIETRLWFEATADKEVPNAVVELSQLFQNPEAGDILVAAGEAWGFRKAKTATHGSLTKADMHIPLWIRGPKIPRGHFGKARGVDLYPTALSWFGFSSPLKNQEGTFLFAPAVEVSDPVAAQLANLEREVMLRPRLDRTIDREKILGRLRQSYPAALQSRLLQKCREEIEERSARWKKLKALREEFEGRKSPAHLKWRLAREQNFEWERLRRMETIKTVLESD